MCPVPRRRWCVASSEEERRGRRVAAQEDEPAGEAGGFEPLLRHDQRPVAARERVAGAQSR